MFHRKGLIDVVRRISLVCIEVLPLCELMPDELYQVARISIDVEEFLMMDIQLSAADASDSLTMATDWAIGAGTDASDLRPVIGFQD